MGKDIHLNKKFSSIRDLLLSQKKEIETALPKHLDADRICRMALTAFRKTPKLLNCDQASLLGAIIQCGQLGFEPDNAIGNVYLIPFGQEVQLIVGYQGMLDLVRRSGYLISLSTAIVYENEPFQYEQGLDPILKHTPLPPSKRGQKIGVYAVAKLKDGGVVTEFMWKEEVEQVQKESKGGNIWKKWGDMMWRKSVIRRIFKYLPKSIELLDGINAEERKMSQKWAEVTGDGIIDVESEEIKNKTENKADSLADSLGDEKFYDFDPVTGEIIPENI